MDKGSINDQAIKVLQSTSMGNIKKLNEYCDLEIEFLRSQFDDADNYPDMKVIQGQIKALKRFKTLLNAAKGI